MEKWNNFHQNDTGIVYFQPNASDRKQLRANGRKRFPFLQSWGTNLNNFQHTQIGSRRVRIVSLNKFPLSNPLAEHGFSWFWVFFQFLGQFGGSGLSGNEWEKQNIWLSLVNLFCQFLDLFCDCSSCPLLFFRGARHLQYLQNNFSPGESPEKKNNLALFQRFSQLCVRAPISSIFPSFPSKKLPLAIVGMGGKCVGFIWFLTILTNFWANLVIGCSLSFLRGTRHLQYPQNNFPPGESPHNGTQPGLFLGIFLTFPIHCHPKSSREKVP